MTTDAWDPAQYERFRDERAQPFFDLLGLVEPVPGGRAIDLGCGTGKLTRVQHDRVKAVETIGIDSSEEMLRESGQLAGGGLRFERGDIANWDPGRTFDLVFSNAALQWVPDHPELFPRLARLLAPGGQLAVQMPANHDHASHVLAHALAREEPFAAALVGYVREVPVESPEWYASVLHGLGFGQQHVRLQVYGHVLGQTADVVEWTKGTLLTDYQRRLPAHLFERFVDEYRRRVVAELGDQSPYFYPFKRLLIWGRTPG